MRDLLWPIVGLLLALLSAYASSLAYRNGQYQLVGVFSLCAFLAVAWACVLAVPRLLRRLGFGSLLQYSNLGVTRRGGFFMALLAALAVSSVAAGNNLLILVLSFSLSALLVSGLVSNLVLYGLKIRLSLPEAIHARQNAVTFVTIRNLKRRFPSFSVMLRGRGRDQEENLEAGDLFLRESRFPYVRAGEALTQRLSCTFRRRGVYPVHGFEVRTRFPLGLLIRRRMITAEGEITVYPALVPIDRLLALYPFLHGSEMHQRRGGGSALYNIRDYQRGDEARFIHWKASGKLSKLMVREFVEEEDAEPHLVFSTHLPERSEANLIQFEKGVSSVTSIVCLYRRRGRSFSFDSGEYRVAVDDRGANFEPLMGYLAEVKPALEPVHLPENLPGSAIVFAAGRGMGLRASTVVDYLTL